MTEGELISREEIDSTYLQYNKEAESAGYHINPDSEFTKSLISGLLTNQKRYGYQSCPCRLSMGSKDDDLDIICPCDYRDQDLDEYGACYCALYVTKAVLDGTRKLESIPDRRLPRSQRRKQIETNVDMNWSRLSLPVWRCKVCGYLCARDGPPEVCPICKAKKERFERFI